MPEDTTARARSRPEDRLGLKAKLYQRTLWPSVQIVANGKALHAPLVVDLDPTSVCDLACPECISISVLNQGGFTRERLDSLVAEIVSAGVRAVILIGGGEPLAHTGIERAIEVLGVSGVRIGLVTNGTLLDRHLDVVARHVDWVRVSVDAATSMTYLSIRPSRSGRCQFRLILRNMREFAQHKHGALGYSFMLVCRAGANGAPVISNASEIAQASRIAKRLGCDYFELKTALDMKHYVAWQSEETLSIVRQQLDEARAMAGDRFGVLVSSSMKALLDGSDRVQPKQYERCFVSELRTLVTPSGVYVCPYHRGDREFQIGDVTHGTFAQVWAASSRGRVNPKRDCLFHCARHETNLALSEIAIDASGGRIVEDYDVFL